MKHILPIILLLIAAGISNARDVTFMWDPNPVADGVTSYRLEILSETGTWTPLGTVASTDGAAPVPTTLRVQVFPERTAVVRAFATSAGGDSLPSDTLTVQSRPGTVQGLKTTVIVNIQVNP